MANPAAVLRILVTANGAQAIGSLRAVEGQAAKTATASERMGKALNTAGKFAALGTGILAGASIKMATDFDKSMRNVNSIAQLPEKNLKTLEKQVLGLAGKTAQAPKTLAEGLYDLVSSGFDAKQSMVILHASAKAATAGLTDTAVSTKAVAAVLNAYHKPAKAAAAVSDTLFQTVNLGVITFEELATTIGDVLPFASQLNIGLNQVGASISTMTKAGLSGAEATTRLKNAYVAFIKPSDALASAIKKTGFESGEALIKSKGFQGALEAVAKTTDGSKAAMGLLFPNIRALGGALSLTGKNAKGANADLKAFGNTSGATNKALSQQSQSLAYQWQKLRAQVSALLIELGMKFIPTLIKVTEWFMKNKGALKTVASAIAIAGAAWIAYRTYALLAAAATTLATGGLNLIIPALAAMAVGIAIAYKRSETFRKIVTGAFSVVKTIIVDYVHIILTVLDKWLGGLQAVMEAASHLPIVGKKFRGIADDIGHAREKVRGLRDAVDNLNGRKVTVQVQVNALLSEFQAGKIPKLGTLSKPGQSRAMGGLVVGGSGSGDKVPLQAMVEPGEQVFVLNRNASAMLDYLQGVNAAVPRFAAGGKLSLSHPGRQIRRAAVEMGESVSARWLKAHPMASAGGGGSVNLKGISGSVARQIVQVGRRMGASKDDLLAAIETGLVESGLQNLAFGDADSLGWRQERVSIYGRAHATSVALSAQDFFNEIRGVKASTTGLRAQAVQRSAFPLRYDEKQSQAIAILRGLGVKGFQSGGLMAGMARVRRKAKPPKPPAKSRHWNPFKGVYQMMTSKQFKALQTRWTKLHSKQRMPSGPTKKVAVPKLGAKVPIVGGIGTIENLLGYFDTAVQAGDLLPDQAFQQVGYIFADALKHPRKYHLSPQDVEQLKAERPTYSLPHFQGETPAATAAADTGGGDPNQPLIDSNDALAAAQQALADQLKGVQDEMKRNNDINEGTLAITAREATRAMTDVLAGQLGYRVNTAGFSPGFGVGARY